MITYFFNQQYEAENGTGFLAFIFSMPFIFMLGLLDLAIVAVLVSLFFFIELYLWLPLVAVVYAVCGIIIYKEKKQ